MEKEQRKLLLVAVSVGVFLLVTITVALVLLTSKTQTQEASYYTANPLQSVENLNHPQPIINNTQETNINFDFDKAETVATIETDEGNRLTIQVPVPSAPAVPDNSETTSTVASIISKPATEPARTDNQSKTAQSAPANSAASNAQSAQPSRTTTLSRAVNDYWIQTGAFAAKVRADDAKELLETKGLTSIIENREIDGRTWYRVRLGPYTSENEANYWLALVKSIDGFGESQVRQTVRQQ